MAKPKSYRLNSGEKSVKTPRGRFDADQYYSLSSSPAATTAAIAGTIDQALYQSERYSTNGTLSYAVPVRNGTYAVVLHFAEFYWTQVGQRVFDISLEGRLVRSHYDIVAKVGPLTATSETLRVTVTDGVLNLDFRVPYESGGVDQAKISAIEILKRRPSSPAAESSPQRVAAAAGPPAPRDLRVYPNPSTGRFTLTCTVAQAQAATLTLSDQRGRTVQEQTVHLEAGGNHVVGEVPNVEPGLCVLSLRPAEGPPQRQKLLIRP